MQVLGADVDDLDALARTFEQESRRLTGSVTMIDAAMRSTWWSGSDAARFETDWQRTHASAVRSVAQLLADASHTLTTQSGQQRQASGGDDIVVGALVGAAVATATSDIFSGFAADGAREKLDKIGKLEQILESEGEAGRAARDSVVNAARELSTSSSAEDRSAAGYILAKYGGDTKFVDTTAFEAGTAGLATIGFFLDVAKYSSEHKSVVEVVTRSGLNTAGSVLGADAGAEAGAALGTMIAPGPGTVVGGVIGAVFGGIAGHEAADIVGGIAYGDYRLVPTH
jgi:hypothetical protein